VAAVEHLLAVLLGHQTQDLRHALLGRTESGALDVELLTRVEDVLAGASPVDVLLRPVLPTIGFASERGRLRRIDLGGSGDDRR